MNIRPENVNLLEGNIFKNHLDIGLGSDFLDMTPTAQATKTELDKWDYIKLKSICAAKETISRMERQPAERRIYLPAI